MDNYTLKAMLDKVLIAPISEELLETLESTCSIYVEDISDDEIDQCVNSYIFQNVNNDLEELLDNENQEDEEDEEDDEEIDNNNEEEEDEEVDDNEEDTSEYNIAPIINIVMSGYCCYMICNETNTRKAAICSLSLMNSIKLQWFDSAKILFPDMITELYFKYDNYQESQTKGLIQSKEANMITPQIFTDDLNLEDIEDAEEFNNQIKSLAYYASLYHLEEVVKKNIISQNSTAPYSDIYNAIYNILTDMPWVFLDKHPAQTINKIMSEIQCQTKKKFSEILAEITNLNEFKHTQPKSNSSIILRMLADNNLCKGSKFVGQKLSIKEFAIALYYELLLEILLNEN